MSSNPARAVEKSVKEEASDESLRAMVDACVSNVAVLDESGAILYASRAWRLFRLGSELGVQSFEPAGYCFESCKRVSDTDITLADDLQRILFADEKEFHHRYCCPLLNEGRPFVMHAGRLNLPGSTFRVLMTHEDVPVAREHTQKGLSQLLDSTKVVAWEAEVDQQRFIYVSEQAVKMLGYPTSDWCEPYFLASHIHPEDRSRVLGVYLKQTRVADHFDLTFRMLGADGRIAWVQNLVSVMPGNDTAGRMHGFMIDISDRKRAEESLRVLGSRLIAAQEEERKRIARELHDDLNQRMAMVSIELDQLGQSLENPSIQFDRLRKLQLQTQEISSDIHRLSYRLHPSKLDHLGLGAAVKSLCDELSQGQGEEMKVHFHQTGLPADLPKDVTLCVFRIAQEALRNCAKHSGAEYVRIELIKSEHALRLSISDNGCGFDTRSDVMEKGLGFISMRERLRLVSGEITIHSQPRRGTRIDVFVPLGGASRKTQN
jgi:PAS domain S-box-containing protein